MNKNSHFGSGEARPEQGREKVGAQTEKFPRVSAEIDAFVAEISELVEKLKKKEENIPQENLDTAKTESALAQITMSIQGAEMELRKLKHLKEDLEASEIHIKNLRREAKKFED